MMTFLVHKFGQTGTSMDYRAQLSKDHCFWYIQYMGCTSFSLHVSWSLCVMHFHKSFLRNNIKVSSGSRFITGAVSFFEFLYFVTQSLQGTRSTYFAMVSTLNTIGFRSIHLSLVIVFYQFTARTFVDRVISLACVSSRLKSEKSQLVIYQVSKLNTVFTRV